MEGLELPPEEELVIPRELRWYRTLAAGTAHRPPSLG
jgi:hypothetical protein